MEDWIVSDPQILSGKPCIRGTRISVAFILELLASGAAPNDILAAYPQLPAEGLAAAFRYAARAMRNEALWEVRLSA